MREYCVRIDEMAKSGYPEDKTAMVYSLSTGQAVEMIKSDVAYFREARVMQVGSTSVEEVSIASISGTSQYRAEVVLDVSNISYSKVDSRDFVTTNGTDALVSTNLTMSGSEDCLLINSIEFP